MRSPISMVSGSRNIPLTGQHSSSQLSTRNSALQNLLKNGLQTQSSGLAKPIVAKHKMPSCFGTIKQYRKQIPISVKNKSQERLQEQRETAALRVPLGQINLNKGMAAQNT